MTLDLLLVAAVLAQAPAPTCNLGCSACPPSGGCRGSTCWPTPIWHETLDVCGAGGSFDLSGTQFAGTCYFGQGCPVSVPPLRYWALDDFLHANHGCYLAREGLIANAELDFGPPLAPGRWVLYQAAWGPLMSWGCNTTGRTVAELSFADAAREGTPGHRAFYLVASVDDRAGYNFDRVSGGNGCNGAEVKVAEVPAPRVAGLSGACSGGAVPVPARARPGTCRFADVDLEIPGPDPEWFSELGRNASPALIDGYQVVYATSDAASDAPTSSSSCSSTWLPARDPARPERALGVVPLGTSAVTVSVPSPGPRPEFYWFALRLVYRDASVNSLLPFDPALEPGPWLMSEPGSHCGPVQAPEPPAPPYSDLELDDGVPWSQVRGPAEPVELTLTWSFDGFPEDGQDVRLKTTIPTCLDATRFQPFLDPSQIYGRPISARATAWDPATLELEMELTAAVPPGTSQTVLLTGLRTGPPTTPGGCCVTIMLENAGCTDPELRSQDAERGGATCMTIAGAPPCDPRPLPAAGLRLDPAGVYPRLTWDPPLDATDHYHVWRVLDGDRTLIPRANQDWSGPEVELVQGCEVVAASSPECFDLSPSPPIPGRAIFYQVRGACASGIEGIEHPY